jgi:hypothetical protein
LAAPGGLGDFMAHLHPAFQSIWASLAGFQQLEPGELERIAAATAAAYGARPRAALEAERARHLLEVIRTLET